MTAGGIPTSLWAGSAILLVFVITAATCPFWVPYSPTATGTSPPFSRASRDHLFGTDNLGRDVLSRVAYGTRTVLPLALASALISILIGGPLGLWSGYLGGWLDEALMRTFEVLISIPLLVFTLLVMSAVSVELGGNPIVLIGVVVLSYVPRIARMTRAVALDLVTRDFVVVARARGESIWHIVFRELLPNATGVLFVEFGIRAGYAPILIGSLGFLGFGLRPPSPEWGLMISENREGIVSAPEAVLAPACAIAALIIGLNLFTDGLARRLGRSALHGPF